MKTFFQLFEAVEHDKEIHQESPLSEILNKISNIKYIVEFALFCAKDCSHLNKENVTAIHRELGVVESFLRDDKSVNRFVIDSAINNLRNLREDDALMLSYWTISAAISTLECVYYALSNSKNIMEMHARHSAQDAMTAFYMVDDTTRDESYYVTVAASFLSRSTLEDGKKNKMIMPKSKIEEPLDLHAIFDELEEHGEDVLIDLGSNKFKLNLPAGHELEGTREEIINKILTQYRWVVDWLKKLYSTTVDQ